MKLFQLSGQTAQTTDSNPALQAVALNEMRLASQIFEYAEFYQMVGNADNPATAAGYHAGDSRAVNSDYTGVATALSEATLTLKILGDTVKTDIAYERRGGNIESERVRQLKGAAKGIGRHFMDLVINGNDSSVATQFDGLAIKCNENSTETVLGGGSDGAQVVLGNDNTAKKSQQQFLYYIDYIISLVGNPSCLIMGQNGVSYLSAIAREFLAVQTVDAALGQNVTFYKGIPIVNAGYSHDLTTSVIGVAETCGSSTDCSSIYAVKFGEKEETTFATNVGVQVRDRGLVGSQYVTMIDFDCVLGTLNTKASRALKGIRYA